MRNIILMAMALLMGMTLSAQTLFHKDDVKRLRKLITQEKVRTPLPMLMSDDQACIDELHDMYKWDAQTAKLKADSMGKRHEENKFIQGHENWAGSSLLKSGKYQAVVRKIEREELRHDLYVRECRIMANDRAADQRPAPKGELLSVTYGSSGMSFNPDLPFTITKMDGDSALVTYSFKDVTFKVESKYLGMMQEAIISEHLYQLHDNYDFKEWDLPDVPRIQLLDGQRWMFEAKFSDGTVISSSGMVSPGLNVEVIPKIYFDSVFPNRAASKNLPHPRPLSDGRGE